MSASSSVPSGGSPRRWGQARHFWLGVILGSAGWAANWLLEGPRTHLLFFPLWLGYILTVDALVLMRSGTSILTRSPRLFGLLFVVSVPSWWLFELLNLRLKNWTYVGRELFTDLEFAVLASISFSTVVPAVFETAELWATFRWTDRFANRVPSLATRGEAVRWGASGAVMLVVLIMFPEEAYALTWLSLLLLIDPLAWRMKRGSLLDHLAQGNWKRVVTLALGALTCGFFWELWNFYSYPKWTYRVPGLQFLHVFEMPLLGYLGYLPFALELESMSHLILGRRMRLICDLRDRAPDPPESER